MFVKSELDIEIALQKNKKICEEKKCIVRLANSKSIYQIDKETNQVIKKWDVTMDVERKLGIYHSSISQCTSGRRKSAGGFVWRYVDNTSYQIGDVYPL